MHCLSFFWFCRDYFLHSNSYPVPRVSTRLLIVIALCFSLVLTIAVNLPTTLILEHSFVKRLSQDISRGFDDRADLNFGLEGSLLVHFYGMRVCTSPVLLTNSALSILACFLIGTSGRP